MGKMPSSEREPNLQICKTTLENMSELAKVNYLGTPGIRHM